MVKQRIMDSQMQMQMSTRLGFGYFVLLCLVVPFSGCDSQKVTVYPATGTVTFKGNPLENADVTFSIKGAEGQPSTILGMGKTDSSGKFSIKTHLDPSQMPLEGAVPGVHGVSISKYVPPGGMSEEDYKKKLAIEEEAMKARGVVTAAEAAPQKVSLLPPQYMSPAASKLTAEVKKDGANNFTFDIK
jgi:hypothetical protein